MKINHDYCVRCGCCWTLAPSAFTYDPIQDQVVVNLDSTDKSGIADAKDACPTEAIT